MGNSYSGQPQPVCRPRLRIYASLVRSDEIKFQEPTAPRRDSGISISHIVIPGLPRAIPGIQHRRGSTEWLASGIMIVKNNLTVLTHDKWIGCRRFLGNPY